jgi:hypothetical protein
MYLFATCCMTISAKHLVRYSGNEMSLGNSGCRVLHGSLFGQCVDRRRELDSAGLCRIQRQIFAVIVIDHKDQVRTMCALQGLTLRNSTFLR